MIVIKQTLKAQIHYRIYIILLMCFAILIPIANKWSNITFLLLFMNWLIEGDFADKYNRLKQRPAFLWISSIYLLFIISFFSSNVVAKRGIDFLIFNFPLLVMPLIMGSSKSVPTRFLRMILWVYIVSNLICTFFGMSNYFHGNYSDIRDISPFIHHVRFGLNLLLCIFILFFFMQEKNKYTLFGKMTITLLLAWFLFYIFFSRILTAIIILPICIMIYVLFYHQYKYSYTKRWVIIFFILLTFLLSAYLIRITIQYKTPQSYTQEELLQKTISGNTYTHDTTSIVENGSRINMFVCEEELKTAWNQRSQIKYDSITGKFPIQQTLIRYLNSKGLKKDKEGVAQLSDKEIKSIETGRANIYYSYQYIVKSHLYPILFGYDIYKKYHKTVGSSLFQRFEIWKNSWQKIQEKPLLGYGIGNANLVVKEQLNKNESLLYNVINPPHCQILNYLLSVGFIGFIIMIFLVGIAIYKEKAYQSPFFAVFFTLIIITSISEDVLSTQAGYTFFYFFFIFFMTYKYEDIIPQNKKQVDDISFKLSDSSYNKFIYFCRRLFLKEYGNHKTLY